MQNIDSRSRPRAG